MVKISTHTPHAKVVSLRLLDEPLDASGFSQFGQAHGRMDNVVHPQLGEDTRQFLEKAGYQVELHAYAMPHAVCPEEIAHIAAWLRRVLP